MLTATQTGFATADGEIRRHIELTPASQPEKA